ncbi:MAG: winged helix-turn-helix domain-containing protein [Xanthomonadaceae bacterium]|nr:winged helix-turn-helix domain-containing protein [Xanthomonadaceae bacterium]
MEGQVRHFRFEGFQLDSVRRELRDPAGQILPLTSKAFDVLYTLVTHRHDVASKDALLLAVWPGRVVEENNLTQAIAALRRALGDDASPRRFIVTVPGRGYRFVATVDEVTDAPRLRRATDVPIARGDAPPLPSPAGKGADKNALGTGRSIRRLGLLVALLVAGLVLWFRMAPAPTGAPTRTGVPAPVATRSIAVLPLVNVSNDQAQQFFSDGLSETLINTLSRFDGLKVIGRSSSFRFRDSREDSRDIGTQLGVAYLLSGSVQRIGDHVRVSVEVVDTADGRTLYAQRFDRPYQDLFALQDEIALAVAGALLGKLPHVHSMVGVVESGHPASGNLEAYTAFLRGAHAMLGNTRQAIEYFAEAVRLDPDYAQAWLWLGFSRAISARYLEQGAALRATCARARADIETAIRLAPDFGLGYSALAVQRTSCDYDWNGALELFAKALPRVTGTSPVHGQYSRVLASLGQVSKAIDARNRQLAADPLTEDGIYWLFLMQASLGQLDDAESSLRRLRNLAAPEDRAWYSNEQSYLSLLRGDQGAALAQARAVPPGSVRERALALALQAGGNAGEADAALRRLIESEGRTMLGSYHIARTYALRGDADAVFEWLDRDWANHGTAAYQILLDPLLLRFRDDPRFAAFCKSAGLPPPSASDALGIDQIRARSAGSH